MKSFSVLDKEVPYSVAVEVDKVDKSNITVISGEF